MMMRYTKITRGVSHGLSSFRERREEVKKKPNNAWSIAVFIVTNHCSTMLEHVQVDVLEFTNSVHGANNCYDNQDDGFE